MPENDPYLAPLPDPNRDALGDPRVKGFLDKIGKSEGADYNTLVGGRKINDLSRHPNIVGLTTSAGPSTAFGKFQITGTTNRSKLAKYSHLDYSPENQDLRAVELLRQTGALDALTSGDEQTAIRRAGKEWASLPGSRLPGRKNYAAFAGSLTRQETQDPYLAPLPQQGSTVTEKTEDPYLAPLPETVQTQRQPTGRGAGMARATQSQAPPIRRFGAGEVKPLARRPPITDVLDQGVAQINEMTRGLEQQAQGRQPDAPFTFGKGAPKKVEVRPAPFTFNQPDDRLLKAQIQTQVASELAPPEPRLLESGAGRGNEIEAETERRFKEIKDTQARQAEQVQSGPAMQAAPESTVTDRLKQILGVAVPAIGLTQGLNLNQRDQQTLNSLIDKYAPGVAALDTPEGIKTDLPRGIIHGATLGAAGQPKPTDSQEEILPGMTRFGLGETAGALVPLAATEGMLPEGLAPAVRTGATFGATGAGRQAVNAVEGRPVDLKAPLVDTALGLVMGGLAGADPGMLRRAAAYVAPGLALDIAQGASPEDASHRALVNLGFAVSGGGKQGEEAPGRIEPQADFTGPTVPTETQGRLRMGDVRDQAQQVGAQLLNPDEVAQGGKPKIRLPGGGSEGRNIQDRPIEDTSVQASTDVQNESSAGAAKSSALNLAQRRVQESAANDVQTGQDSGVISPRLQGESSSVPAEPSDSGIGAQGETQRTVSTAPESVSEPIRHVDEQARRQRGEGKGQFKKETTAQTEERRAKVEQASQPEVPAPTGWQGEVFHGTKSDFEQFDLKRAGLSDPGLVGKAVYFTPTRAQAESFSTSRHYGKGDSPRVIAAQVGLENPLIITDGVLPDGRRLSDIHRPGITKQTAAAFRKEIIKQGHDGVVFKDESGEVAQVAVFDPSKITIQPKTLASQPASGLNLTKEDGNQIVDERGQPLTPEASPLVSEGAKQVNTVESPEDMARRTRAEDIASGRRSGRSFQDVVKLSPTEAAKLPDRDFDDWARTRTKTEGYRGTQDLANADELHRAYVERGELDRAEAVRNQVYDGYHAIPEEGTPEELANMRAYNKRQSDAARVMETRERAGKPLSPTQREARPEPLQPETPKEPSTTSARKSQMTEDRASLDLPELPPAERKSWQTSLSNAKPEKATVLADEVLTKPRALNDEETASLVVRAQQIKNEHAQVMKEIGGATDSGEISAKRAQAEALEREFDRLTTATKASGTKKGRALASQKLTINQDFDLISVKQRMKAAKGRDLTEAESKKYADMVKERDQAILDRDAALERAHTAELQKQINRSTRQRARAETKEALDTEAVTIKTNIAAEFARLKSAQSSVHSAFGLGSLDPEGVITKELLKYARNRVKANVGLKAEELIDEVHDLVKDFGASRRQVAEVLSGYMKPRDTREVDQATKQLADIRKEIKGLLTKEDVAAGTQTETAQGPSKRFVSRNTTRLKQLQAKEADLTARIAQRDFSPRQKPEPLPYTREVVKAQDRVTRVENEFKREAERADPWHWLRDASGIRKAGMLSGPLTHVRNILGTAAHVGFEEVRRLPSVIVDAAMAPVTRQRTVTLSPSAMLDGVVQAVKVGGREATEILKHGATKEQLEKQQLQEINTGAKVVDTAFNSIFRFMSASDRVFYQLANKRNLVERAQAQAKTEARTDKSTNWRERAKELTENPSEQMQSDAQHDALVATFNNNNRLSDAIKRGRGALGPVGNFAVDMVLPFDRTPTNVIARVIEASPAGYLKNGKQVAQALWRKEFTPEQQRAFSETFGRATTGTSIIALGFALAAKGLLTTDDYGTTYLEFHGHKFNLSAVAPMGTLLGAGAGLQKQHAKEDPTKRGYAGAVLKPLADQPVLRASSQVSDVIKDPQRSAARTGAGLAFSAVPMSGAVRTLATTIDPADRRYPQGFKETFQQNIPGWRNSLPIDKARLFGSVPTKASQEVQRLGVDLKGPKQGKEETSEAFAKRQQVVNTTLIKELNSFVDSRRYTGMSDKERTEWIRALPARIEDQYDREQPTTIKPRKAREATITLSR